MSGQSDLRVTRLDNGLTVATERVHGARSVATGAFVAVGARDEPATSCGISHFLEHLLFKGTATRTTRDIATAVERVGGDLNAYTSKEHTAFYCRVPASSLAMSVDVLGDVLSAPALRDGDIETERSVILDELAMDDDSPEDVVHRVLTEALFPGHPLGRETAGERDTVAALAAQAVRDFHARWYTAANTVVSVAGAIDHDEVCSLVEASFARVPAGGDRPPRTAPDDGVGADVEDSDDLEQAQVAVGVRAYGRDDERREALDVLSHALGGGPSSRLFEEIREKRGLAYSVYSSPSAWSDAGALAVYAGTAAEHLDTVLGLVEAELDRLAAGGITAEERDVAVGYLCGSYVMGLEDIAARMARTGTHLVARGFVRPVEEQLARWEAVTVDAVGAVAADLLAGRRVRALLVPADA